MVFRKLFRRPERTAPDLAPLSGLGDPVRAAILDHVSRSGADVSRDQAAKAVGVSRRVAAFHLDRLAEAGWLDVSFRRLGGRRGPGAGRSSKLYRRSAKRLDVSIPARNYELIARMLASAALERSGPRAAAELEPGVREFGETLGAAARNSAGRHPAKRRLVRALFDELTEQGFEPFADDGAVRLRNCPFHEMARENTDLVCSTNLALMKGVLKGLDVPGVTAKLEPRAGTCCVAFHMTQK
ncbi:MAG TPA: helix-turn-helix domain-containing protein [Candidatus Dormibacteraeota bacterium]|nr:helix-turn-helix domain-containing protein [Candidatus Dormibacteraeota bacterium]